MGSTRQKFVMSPVVETGSSPTDARARDRRPAGLEAASDEPPETSQSVIRFMTYRGQPALFEYRQWEYGFWGAKYESPRRRKPELMFPQKDAARNYYLKGDVLHPCECTEKDLRRRYPRIFGPEPESEGVDWGQTAFHLLLGLEPPTFKTALKIREIRPGANGKGAIDWDLLIQLDEDENSVLTISPLMSDSWLNAHERWCFFDLANSTSWIEPTAKVLAEVCLWVLSAAGSAGKKLATTAARRAVLKLAGRHFVKKAASIAGTYTVKLILAFAKSFFAQRATDDFLLKNRAKFQNADRLDGQELLAGAIIVAFADAMEAVVVKFIEAEVKLPQETSQELAKLLKAKVQEVAKEELAKLFVGEVVSLVRAVGQQVRLDNADLATQKAAWQNEMLKSSKLKDAVLALAGVFRDRLQESFGKLM